VVYVVVQCMIIRNTQLAAARERFEEVEKREKDINGRYSPASLLDRLQGSFVLFLSSVTKVCDDVFMAASWGLEGARSDF
jgi:hypothetical protein